MQNNDLLRDLAEDFRQLCSKQAVATKCTHKAGEAIVEIVVVKKEQTELLYLLRIVTTAAVNISISGWSSFRCKRAENLAKSCMSDLDPTVPKTFYSTLLNKGRVALITETTNGSMERQRRFNPTNAAARQEMQTFLANIARLVFDIIKPKYEQFCSIPGIVDANSTGIIGSN